MKTATARETVYTAERGDGTIFFRLVGGRRVSRNLYLAYRAQGKEYVVSAKTADLADAKRELKRLLLNRDSARIGKEPLITPKSERVTIAEALDLNVARATSERLANVKSIRCLSGTLKTLLGHLLVIDLRPAHALEYAARRRDGKGTKRGQKVGEATIARELEILRVALNNLKDNGEIGFVPHIPMPRIDNVSAKEFPQERIEELLARLRERGEEALADLTEFMGLTARRPEGLRKLSWSRYDAKTAMLEIPPEKGGNPVWIAVSDDLLPIMERRIAARRLGCDLIFHRDGKKMQAWKDRSIFREVYGEMGIPYGRESGLTLYNVKSTSIGLMVDAGLSLPDIKARSGHKTDSQVERYLKQNPQRARAASLKLAAHLAKIKTDRKSEVADRVAVFKGNSEN